MRLSDLEKILIMLENFKGFEISNIEQMSDDAVRVRVDEYRHFISEQPANIEQRNAMEMYLEFRKIVKDLRMVAKNSTYGQFPVILREPEAMWEKP